jgi:internalin A
LSLHCKFDNMKRIISLVSDSTAMWFAQYNIFSFALIGVYCCSSFVRGDSPPRAPEERETVAILEKESNAKIEFNVKGRAESVRFGIRRAGLTADQILAEIGKLHDVCAVEICCTTVSSDGVAKLLALPRLTVLHFYETRLDRRTMATVGTMKNLKLIVLARVVFDGGSLQQLEGISGLERLCLNGSKIDDDGLAAVSKFRRLKLLDLSGTKITNRGLRHLEGLVTLEQLTLPREITDAGVAHLRNLTNLANLGTADYNLRKLTDAGMVYLGRLHRLQQLDLHESKVTDRGMEYLSEMKGLAYLDLSRTMVGDEGIRKISKLTWLTQLAIQETRVTDDGLRSLQSIRNLRHLSVSPRIGEKGMGIIAKIPALQALDIDVRGNDALVHLKEMPRLESLGLSGAVTDAGVEYLRQCPTLQSLHLGNAPLTDGSVRQLSKLRGLRILGIYRTQITEEGYKKLQSALPATEVTWDGNEDRSLESEGI